MDSQSPEYEHALEVLRERLPYNIQRRDPDTGIWRIVGRSVRGHTAALDLLNRAKRDMPGIDFRVLPKNESDKYAEGLAAGQGLSSGDRSSHRSRRRKPLQYMPDHL